MKMSLGEKSIICKSKDYIMQIPGKLQERLKTKAVLNFYLELI